MGWNEGYRPEHVTIFVEDIVPAVLTRGGE